MNEILELLKIFAIGAGAGVVYALVVKRNQMKYKKDKERNLRKNLIFF